MDVRRVAEQETPAVAKSQRAPMVDAVRREPRARLEGQRGSGFSAQRGSHALEGHVLPAPQGRRQNADHPPVVLAAHREEQVKPLPPQVDVHFVRNHAPGRLRVGESGLDDHRGWRHASSLGRDQGLGWYLPDWASCQLVEQQPGGRHRRPIRGLERDGDVAGLLLEAHELGVPFDRHAPVGKPFAHEPFVVVLAEDQDVRVWSHAPAGVAQRDVRHLPTFRPDVGAVAPLSELERAVDDSELRVDLERARLYAERPGLTRRPGVPVDDPRADAPPAELIREHQPGRAGSDDQDVGFERSFFGWTVGRRGHRHRPFSVERLCLHRMLWREQPSPA